MEDIRISGMGDLPGGEYRSVSVSGMGKCTGALSAQSVTVNGTFNCKGSLDSQTTAVNGTLKCAGPLRTERFSCNGMADLLGDTVANTLTVGGMVHVKAAKLEGAEITCTGILQSDGQISADRVKVTGVVKAREIVGDHVSIRSHHVSLLKMFLPSASSISSADLIEATTIDLEGVKAGVVNGHDITIGAACTVDCVDCTGTLRIHPSAAVGSVTGDYTMLG
ncbi:hypothetical protein [Lawsonibacter faecis]|uniref:Polymer-forming cytoskeletal protein n=1 Tax=Lawsonibacter faecis TaxID=2763052 RepID=A0A8J6JF30_9FIRM|nr:hypothetical protein [Lawsonibacter faecis]MBC5738391.1 hypothetical protein [Lawsonibacter faecis]